MRANKIVSKWFGCRCVLYASKAGYSFTSLCEYEDLLSMISGLCYDKIEVEVDDGNIVVENNYVRSAKDYITVKIINEDGIVWGARRLWCNGKHFIYSDELEKNFQDFLLEAI